MGATNQTGERREFGRRRSVVHGWIRIDGRPRVACIVRNLSDGGALLEPTGSCDLPHEFRLSIASLKLDVLCKKRHFLAGVVGVEFISEPAATSDRPTYSSLLEMESSDLE